MHGYNLRPRRYHGHGWSRRLPLRSPTLDPSTFHLGNRPGRPIEALVKPIEALVRPIETLIRPIEALVRTINVGTELAGLSTLRERSHCSALRSQLPEPKLLLERNARVQGLETRIWCSGLGFMVQGFRSLAWKAETRVAASWV